MNAKQFLLIGGIVLVVVGLLGMPFIGLIGPTPADSIFGETWWFDTAENWAHLVIGVVGIIAAFAFPRGVQRGLVWLLGIVGVLVGIYSLAIGPEFLGANLEQHADTLLHLVVGLWALFAAYRTPKMAMSQPM